MYEVPPGRIGTIWHLQCCLKACTALGHRGRCGAVYIRMHCTGSSTRHRRCTALPRSKVKSPGDPSRPNRGIPAGWVLPPMSLLPQWVARLHSGFANARCGGATRHCDAQSGAGRTAHRQACHLLAALQTARLGGWPGDPGTAGLFRRWVESSPWPWVQRISRISERRIAHNMAPPDDNAGRRYKRLAQPPLAAPPPSLLVSWSGQECIAR